MKPEGIRNGGQGGRDTAEKRRVDAPHEAMPAEPLWSLERDCLDVVEGGIAWALPHVRTNLQDQIKEGNPRTVHGGHPASVPGAHSAWVMHENRDNSYKTLEGGVPSRSCPSRRH